jgi:hypothetical protein
VFHPPAVPGGRAADHGQRCGPQENGQLPALEFMRRLTVSWKNGLD